MNRIVLFAIIGAMILGIGVGWGGAPVSGRQNRRRWAADNFKLPVGERFSCH